MEQWICQPGCFLAGAYLLASRLELFTVSLGSSVLCVNMYTIETDKLIILASITLFPF